MSINVEFLAHREILVLKTGKVETQERFIDIWQTPSDVTMKILKSDDPIEAYKDWAISSSEEIEEEIFEDDDGLLFSDEPPKVIGTRIIHPGKEHVEELNEIIELLTQDGYDIDVICV